MHEREDRGGDRDREENAEHAGKHGGFDGVARAGDGKIFLELRLHRGNSEEDATHDEVGDERRDGGYGDPGDVHE